MKVDRKGAEMALWPRSSDGRFNHRRGQRLVGQLNGILGILANSGPWPRRAVYIYFNFAVI